MAGITDVGKFMQSFEQALRAKKTIAESLDVVREKMLEYDPATDRSGKRWDQLRVELDVEIRAAQRAIQELQRSGH